MKKEDIIKDIKKNYKRLEISIASQLLLETPHHHSTSGNYREQIWKSLFRQIVPHKFSIEQGVFLIDSSKSTNISKEIDLVIFDEQYTPYIFNYGKIKFIPIEAVAVVIQCKSSNIIKTELEDWVKSIDALNTNSDSITRMAVGISFGPPPTQPATRPIKILCALEKCTTNKQPRYGFDIAIHAEIKKNETEKSDENYKLNVSFSDKIDNLHKAYKEFNRKGLKEEGLTKEEDKKKLENKLLTHLKIRGENSILSLIFQLNQLLMLINNPMLFPHQAYVNMFNDSEI